MSKDYKVGDRVTRMGRTGTILTLEMGATNSGRKKPAARIRWDDEGPNERVYYRYLFEEFQPLKGKTDMAKAKGKTKAKASSSGGGKACECGCGRKASEGSRFLPGHDMKLKSKLIAGAKCGNASAISALKKNGWPVPKKV